MTEYRVGDLVYWKEGADEDVGVVVEVRKGEPAELSGRRWERWSGWQSLYR